MAVFGVTLGDVRKSVERTREALDAETPTIVRYDREGNVRETVEGGADHGIRLSASDRFLRIADVYPDRQREPTDPSRPVAVTIVLAGRPDARALPDDHGVRIHLRGGNGHGP